MWWGKAGVAMLFRTTNDYIKSTSFAPILVLEHDSLTAPYRWTTTRVPATDVAVNAVVAMLFRITWGRLSWVFRFCILAGRWARVPLPHPSARSHRVGRSLKAYTNASFHAKDAARAIVAMVFRTFFLRIWYLYTRRQIILILGRDFWVTFWAIKESTNR